MTHEEAVAIVAERLESDENPLITHALEYADTGFLFWFTQGVRVGET